MYDEREDEFDIVSPTLTLPCSSFTITQEDETALEMRKMKEEEELVDVADEATKPGSFQVPETLDEDARWAEEDPDEDTDRAWHLPVLMEDDEG